MSGRVPFLLLVAYDIQYLSNGTVEVKKAGQLWSSSVVLSAVHPVLLLHWQPRLEGIFVMQGMIINTTVNISLSIVEDVGESPPGPELECAVWKLTGWVSWKQR